MGGWFHYSRNIRYRLCHDLEIEQLSVVVGRSRGPHRRILVRRVRHLMGIKPGFVRVQYSQ